MIEQLTVFIENADGRLTALCRALADAQVNMRALVVADTSEYGIVRIICDDAARGRKALSQAGFRAACAEVVAVEVPDRPGGLAQVLSALDDAQIGLEYGYCFTGRDGAALVALKASEEAEGVLEAAGFAVVSGEGPA
jgi:hypothetical protein